MALRRTITRWFKWIGTTVCLMILVLFVVSIRRAVTWDSSGLRWEVGLLPGTVAYGWRPEGWHLADERYPPTPGWSMASYAGSPKTNWWVVRGRIKSWYWIEIPLWMPFVIAAVPTVLLWHRDRRIVPVGCCQKCGYDLTGNVSGVCPECGKGFSDKQNQDHS